MGEVTHLTDGVMSFSLRRLADELGMDRDTLRKRIAAYGVKPAARRAGHPVYRLRDVIPALYSRPDDGDKAGHLDPSKMTPTDRKAHYQAENERLKFLAECGQLVLAPQAKDELAFVAKTVSRFHRTLADTFERDTRCPPEYTEALDRLVRRVGEELAAAIGDFDADEGDDVRISS